MLETCPEVEATRLSRLLFLWTDGLTKKSETKALTDDGLWDINPREKCETVCPEFRRHLIKKSTTNSNDSTFATHKPHTCSKQEGGLRRRKGKTIDDKNNYVLEEPEPPDTEDLQSNPRKYSNLWIVIFRTFWKEFLYSQGCRLLQFSMFWLTNPHFMSLLMDHNADPDSSPWYGVLLSVTLLVLLVTGSLAVEHCFFSKQNLEIHLESALMTTVYRKAMNLHTRARKTYSIGELTNYMLSDCDNIACHLTQINYLLLTPVHFIIVFYQLYQILGPASFLGLLFIILITPINVCAAIKMRSLYEENARNRDQRMKLLNEVLVGIKVLKLNAWETCFGEKLKEARQKEIEVIRKNLNYRAFTVFSWNASPYVVSVVMFCGYFLMNEDSILTAKSAFAVVSLLNLLRYAINDTPELLFHFMKTSVALNRLQNFLRAEEYSTYSQNESTDTDSAICIQDGEFSWDSDTNSTLKNINMDIPEGKLVSIVGQVGAGKSSIISAILGEIQKVKGHMHIRGTIGYVSQQAWIQNDSLQNNILFGKDLDRELYRRVIQACALQPDLDLLPAGDQTEIGERGINLSGGQKQRVSLARAVYNDADIYLLDDPLSAVDSHVGKNIFDQAIGDNGILRDKTRVLVTHNISYLPQVDSIIVVDDGRIVETGTFLGLLNSDGAFTTVIRSFFADYEENRECLIDTELDMALDDNTKAKLERLESQEMNSAHNPTKRQTSRDTQRQVSRQLSTPETSQKADGRCIQEEEDIVDTSKLQKWNMFKEYTRSFGTVHMVWVCVVYALYYILWAGANILLVQWTEDPVFQNVTDGSRRDVWWTNMMYLGVYSGLGLAMSLCILIYAIVVTWGIVRASEDLYNRLLMSILRSPMEFFDTTPVGRITSRFSSDMDTIDDSLPENLEYWLDCAMNICVAMFAVLYSTPTMLSVIIPLVYYYYALQLKHTERSCFLRSLSSKARSPIESRFTESVTGAETVRAYRAQERFRETVESKIDNYHRMYFYQLLNHRWLGVHMLAMGNLVCASSALIRSVVRGAQSAGLLGLGTAFTVEINGCMNWFVILQSIVENQLTSVERIIKYIDTPDEATWRRSRDALSDSWPRSGTIEFRYFSLRYREHLDLVLNNISFTVQGGEKIGVVGRTGAGKSSLVLSLFRLIEAAEGAILIDGVGIQNIGLHDLREGLAIIPQDPVLFTGTLRMNLDPEVKYKDEEIWVAIDHTHLKTFVESLPDKLGTECGEGGSNFSLGQRQLFCLARTLLRKSKILVLDEATAAVDMETDDLIQQTIRSEFKDCTVLTIAHRLNTVMDYDRILVLDQGRVVEFDSPDSLVEQKGLFYKMTVDAGIGINSRTVSS